MPLPLPQSIPFHSNGCNGLAATQRELVQHTLNHTHFSHAPVPLSLQTLLTQGSCPRTGQKDLNWFNLRAVFQS